MPDPSLGSRIGSMLHIQLSSQPSSCLAPMLGPCTRPIIAQNADNNEALHPEELLQAVARCGSCVTAAINLLEIWVHFQAYLVKHSRAAHVCDLVGHQPDQHLGRTEAPVCFTVGAQYLLNWTLSMHSCFVAICSTSRLLQRHRCLLSSVMM